MPKYDEFFKILLRHCPRDFVKLLYPDHPVDEWKISLENVEVQALQDQPVMRAVGVMWTCRGCQKPCPSG